MAAALTQEYLIEKCPYKKGWSVTRGSTASKLFLIHISDANYHPLRPLEH